MAPNAHEFNVEVERPRAEARRAVGTNPAWRRGTPYFTKRWPYEVQDKSQDAACPLQRRLDDPTAVQVIQRRHYTRENYDGFKHAVSDIGRAKSHSPVARTPIAQ
jgi:hypothetical protein